MPKESINIAHYKKAQLLVAAGLSLLAIAWPVWLRLYTLEHKGYSDLFGIEVGYYLDSRTAGWMHTLHLSPLLIAIILFFTLPKKINIGFFIFLGSVIFFNLMELYDAVDYALGANHRYMDNLWDWKAQFWMPLVVLVLIIWLRKLVNRQTDKRIDELQYSIQRLNREELEQLAAHFVKIEQGIISITNEHEEEVWKRVLLKYVNSGYKDITTKLTRLDEAKN